MKQSHRIAGLVGVVVAAALITWGAVSYHWFPTLISPTDGKIDSLYKWLLIASVPFFVIIVAAIAFMLVEFRAEGEDDERDGAPLHGSTTLEAIWTIIPTIVLIGLGIYAWSVLNDVEAKQPDELKVRVIGQQFAWSFEYLDKQDKVVAESNELIVPVGKPLDLVLISRDVIHSFFVPNVRLKRDATPGVVKHLRFRPTKLGAYPIICAELCGIGHATMRQTLRVVPNAKYVKWFKAGGGKFTVEPPKGGGGAKGGTQAGGDTAKGKAVYTANGCGACHALTDAKTTGRIGPSLDGRASLGAAAMLESIVAPDKKITKGFSKGVMPPNYGTTISQQDLDALVAYLMQAGK